MKKKLIALLTALAVCAMVMPLTANASSVITATPHTVTDYEWHYNLVEQTHPAKSFTGCCLAGYNFATGVYPSATFSGLSGEAHNYWEYGICPNCGHDNARHNSHSWECSLVKPCGVSMGLYQCGVFYRDGAMGTTSQQYSILLINSCESCGYSGSTITIPEHTVWYCPTCASDSTAGNMQVMHVTEPGQTYYCSTCNGPIADVLASSHKHPVSKVYAHTRDIGTITDYYYNTKYGYKGDSSTFTVYDITTEDCTVSKVVTPNYTSGLSTTAAIEGATVSLSFSSTVEAVFVWLPGQIAPHISYYTKNGYLPDSSKITSYSFTMPASDIRITTAGPEALLTVSPTIGDSSLTVGQVTQVNPNATEGAAVTYSSSDATGLVVNSTGVVTAKKKGSCIITVTGTL